MPIPTPTPFLPVWLALPAAAAAMLLITWHLATLHAATPSAAAVPSSRKRVRTANGVLMLLLTPLLAYALAALTPASARAFILVWMAILGLVGIVVLLAVIDTLNTVRLNAAARRVARDEARRRMVAQILSRRDGASRSG